MMLVVTYDVNTSDPGGARRLRQVAKICENYGCRVQKSVFELLIDPAQLVSLKESLTATIDADNDSIRLYRLGSNWRSRVECIGKALRFEQDGVIIL